MANLEEPMMGKSFGLKSSIVISPERLFLNLLLDEEVLLPFDPSPCDLIVPDALDS
jgi:hypothetical protein